MHFGFNNQFIKVKRTLAKISKTTKNLFCFSIRDYEFIRKTYSWYKKGIVVDDIEQLGFIPLR